jgi:hypothetical protein
MSNSIAPLDPEPWRGLPPAVADVIEPELPAVTEEILATIAREVPEYARPFAGSFGRGIRTGVREALHQFVALVRDPDAGREQGREVYVALGRGELRQGRTLDSLQAAYRVGARVAWRRLAAAGRRAGLDAETISVLAESIFAYIDELSADSVEGYAQAQSEHEGMRQQRRRELLALLIREAPVPEGDIEAAAAAVGWRLPAVAAAIAVPEDALEHVVRRLPPDVVAGAVDGAGCVVVPDPSGPGRRLEIERALAKAGGAASGDSGAVAIGPSGPIASLSDSWALARRALAARQRGSLRGRGPVVVDDRLADMALLEAQPLIERIAARRLAPLAELSPKARRRMGETALAYLRERGNAAAMARIMNVHPQTARYRLARLRDLLGSQIDDPEARFELELALRSNSEFWTKNV